ncbi:MAG: YitT family protein [Paludibacteraceae bacterium]|nr:YitT family protein [Paludibacteraceae bacterium]
MGKGTFQWTKELRRIGVIIIAALLMAANIRTLVHTGGLYPGGATGLTILILRIGESFFGIHLHYTFINIILNAIPIYIGFRFIGRKFTIYSCLMILLTGIFTDLIPSYVITEDILLISIFGGIINGLAICLCLLVDATSGGTDFIAIYMSEKKHRDSWNISLAINIVILIAAGFLFGWDKALYSIIFQYASTQILHTLHKRYQKETLLITTTHPDTVCDVIAQQSNHGATIMESEGSTHNKNFLVYSVVSREEYIKIIHGVKKADPDAFINTINTDKLMGKFYQRNYKD